MAANRAKRVAAQLGSSHAFTLIELLVKDVKALARDLTQRCTGGAGTDLVITLGPVRDGLRMEIDVREAPCFSAQRHDRVRGTSRLGGTSGCHSLHQPWGLPSHWSEDIPALWAVYENRIVGFTYLSCR